MNDDVLELVLRAKEAAIPGGLQVRRAIPQIGRRSVGPFVFVDQMGPTTLAAGQEITVLPHPHIGLATVTYLFEGEGLHRDSLGVAQPILPGEVNWMSAGRGIVHSERLRAGPGGRLYGVQTWVALPRALEESEPWFRHYDADAAPSFTVGTSEVKLIAGSLLGATSQVQVDSPLFYADVRMPPGAALDVPATYEERAVYVVEGDLDLGARPVRAGEMAFLRPGAEAALLAPQGALVLLLGGDALDGPRHISWNFVSSSKERLEQAAEDWRQQRFPRVPGETAYIPLPRDGSEPVNYP